MDNLDTQEILTRLKQQSEQLSEVLQEIINMQESIDLTTSKFEDLKNSIQDYK